MYCSDAHNSNKEAENTKKRCSNAIDDPKCESSNNLEKSVIDTKHNNTKKIDEAISDFPRQLVKFMYTNALSVFCLLKKNVLRSKYKGMMLSFEDNEIEHFSNLVLRFDKKSTHVCVIYLNSTHFTQSITYTNLFGKTTNLFSINTFFNSYAKYMLTKSHASSYKPKYLIVWSNINLEITKDQKLKEGRSRDFYPFDFVNVDVQKCSVLKDFLSVNDNVENLHFYKFSLDIKNKNELIKRLEYSTAMKNIIKSQHVPEEFQDKLKESFLRKLIYIICQPSREELISIIDYNVNRFNQNILPMQDIIMNSSSLLKKNPILCNFELLLSLTTDIFIENKIFSINLVEYEKKIMIKLHHRDKVSYIINLDAFTSFISYKDLFLSKKEESKKKITLNALFSFFIGEYEKNPNIKFIVIYTNSDLDIDKYICRPAEGEYRSTNPFNLEEIDMKKKRYKLFRRSFTLDNKKMYKFSLVNYTFLSRWINYDDASQEIKELFLHKIIIANEQINAVKNDFGTEFSKVNIPYNYESLQEATLRWAEFYYHEPITQRLMRILLNDIKENKSSSTMNSSQDISDELKFVKQSIYSNHQNCQWFLHFLVKGEGKKYFADFKKEGLNLTSIAFMMNSTIGTHAIESFKKLHNLWFDENGKLKMYLKVLHKNCYRLSEISCMIESSTFRVADVFKELFYLFFTEDGKKTKYLLYLEKEQIKVSSIASIIEKSGCGAKQAYIDLFNLWFDEHGNKTELLKNLQANGIKSRQISNMMRGSGSKGPATFKKLYDLWFDSEGNKSKYFSCLLDGKISFSNFSTVLSGSGGCGTNIVNAYKSLYHTWFDAEGKPNIYLERLEKNGISLTSISLIMSGAKSDYPSAFKNYYLIWFDEDGNETKYLKSLKSGEINIDDLGKILKGSTLNASKIFKDLYDLFFDDQGRKREHLKCLEKNNISFKALSKVLERSALKAITAFMNLFKLWFDENGNKTYYLTNLENHGINLLLLLRTIEKANFHAAEQFLNLYDLLFKKNGKESHYLKVIKKHLDFKLMVRFIRMSGDPSQMLKNLIDLWFDEEGNKTKYLFDFENEGISLKTLYSVFYSAQVDDLFKRFYHAWFKKKGGKKSKLKLLEKKKVNLNMICSILYNCRGRPAEYFNNLYAYWYNEQGEETYYIQNLKAIGIELDTICYLLEKASIKAIQKFTKWYEIFFDGCGNKTNLLITLTNAGIDLKSMCNIFVGYGNVLNNKDENFKELFNCWYDKQGKKTHYTEVLEQNRISLNDICKILKGAGTKAVKSFIGFYNLLFDEEGNATIRLQHFIDNNFNISVLWAVLHNSGYSATTNFKNWHTLCIDRDGNKQKPIAALENYGIDLLQLKSVVALNEARTLNKTLNLLFKAWFDKNGNKTPKLMGLENLGLSLTDVFEILKGSGKDAPDIFMNLYNLFYDVQGEMSMYALTLQKNSIKLSSFFQSLLENSGSQIVEAFQDKFSSYFDEEGNTKSTFIGQYEMML